MKIRKTYKAQALAIIMVTLVVASIIGFSVSSRLVTQRKSVLDERNSSEALQVVDMILDNILLSSPDEWEAVGMQNKDVYVEVQGKEEFQDPPNKPDPIPPYESQLIKKSYARDDLFELKPEPAEPIIIKDPIIRKGVEISDLMEALGNPLNLQELDICPVSQDNNRYTLKLQDTDENTKFYIQSGESFVFPINEIEACSINLTFDSKSSGTGLVINKIYADGNGTKVYDYQDTESYCIGPCNKDLFDTETKWIEHSSLGTPLSIPIDPQMKIVQLTAITAGNKDLIFSFSTPGCENPLKLWNLQASATCSGTYRAKETIVPHDGWAYPLFNHVIFNGYGVFNSDTQ